MNRPTIVCLVGSTRFFEAFTEANYQETLAGRIVLSVGFFMHTQKHAHGQNVGITDEQKAKLDELHLRKIDLADEVLCINVDDYVGSSTQRELWYALNQQKRIRMLEPTRHDIKAIRSWFVDWNHWLRAAKEAASTLPTYPLASQR